MKKEKIKDVVRKGYGKIAKTNGSCGCSPSNSCCGGTSSDLSKRIGYSDSELSGIPQGSDLGLGCGNPTVVASIRKGDTVLDLGSGAGIDCFLAAQKVGKKGKVIGIDMTPEMIAKARENVLKGNYTNVEFRLGEIENLPVENDSVDVIISNCVINLSPDKNKAFKEAFRVLKPGGKIFISDLVTIKELPKKIKDSAEAYIGCLSGAILKEQYINAIRSAGFREVKIISETNFPIENMTNDATANATAENANITMNDFIKIADSIVNIELTAHK
ncbi:MAG: arsenite methyltransferase [Elusimicrobia bacterium]|nr:arsenite methyltransferase [Elusimicrobiota bacterium]